MHTKVVYWHTHVKTTSSHWPHRQLILALLKRTNMDIEILQMINYHIVWHKFYILSIPCPTFDFELRMISLCTLLTPQFRIVASRYPGSALFLPPQKQQQQQLKCINVKTGKSRELCHKGLKLNQVRMVEDKQWVAKQQVVEDKHSCFTRKIHTT